MKALIPLFIVFLLARAVSAQSGADYYPLGIDNFWVYKNTVANDSALFFAPDRREVAVFQVDGKSTVAGVRNEYNQKSDTYYWFKKLPEGRVILFSLGIGPDLGRSLMDFNPPFTVLPEKTVVGATWETKMLNDENKLFTSGKYRIESDRETVTVPAGTFRNCLKVKHVTLDENGKEMVTIMHYYAQGVGEVLSEQVEPEDKRYRSELKEYSVK